MNITKTNLRLIMIIMCFVALVGCSRDNENKLNLDDVLNALKSQNLELEPYGITGYPMKLNDVIPEVYSVKLPGSEENNNTDEFIHFYIFNSEKDRLKGAKEFSGVTGNINSSTFPFPYEKENILIIYWSNSNDHPLMKEAIETALEQLNS
ncbi:hypothetical protein [Paenibacillus cucumis (ex Kampfer et al. 2016)]|uniref:DUF4367 domain-containing protein n=1 Tax=Paenibacillus cucumis (ex Kampfer et al. 2016) TaxID=1776858 RepID=A0ABS7KN77_9BACL|nr:hypothetical protein [Paenibacillus cucumis (ex Kampfer et al. 2016)]MBY0205637.1 hypothetical protein [Paenibacillus cucumis (ex Kampfer et al. 2016)]